MASKEALFIALDVSDSMRPHLDDVTGAVQRMLCDRIFHSKQDAVGLLARIEAHELKTVLLGDAAQLGEQRRVGVPLQLARVRRGAARRVHEGGLAGSRCGPACGSCRRRRRP